MQSAIALLIVTALRTTGQQAVHMPTAMPDKVPARMKTDFERGKSGDVFAMIRMNKCYGGGHDLQVFPATLIRQKLEELVRQGNPKAMVTLADNLPWENDSVKNKVLEARRRTLIEQAAELGEPTAMNEYAAYLFRKDNNKEEAVKWWIKGKRLLEERAKAGDPEAIVALAWYGSVPDAARDPGLEGKLHPSSEWVEWLRKAAEIDRNSAVRYGFHLLSLNPKEGIKWIEKSANEGDWVAMVQMGRFWAFGFPDGNDRKFDPETHPHLKKKTDPARAWEWWDKAAELVGWDLVDERLPEIGSDIFPDRPEKKK